VLLPLPLMSRSRRLSMRLGPLLLLLLLLLLVLVQAPLFLTRPPTWPVLLLKFVIRRSRTGRLLPVWCALWHDHAVAHASRLSADLRTRAVTGMSL
jgi:hypothetical protein